MNIYVIYKDGIVINASPVPRVALDGFKLGADRVQVWRNDKLIRTFNNAGELNRFINPKPNEDEESVNSNYEW